MALFRFRGSDKPDPSKVDEAAKSGAPVDSTGSVSPEATADEAGGAGRLFDRFRAGLKKTVQVLNTDVRDLFKQEGRLVDES